MTRHYMVLSLKSALIHMISLQWHLLINDPLRVVLLPREEKGYGSGRKERRKVEKRERGSKEGQCREEKIDREKGSDGRTLE